jgi:riboflavin kinase/FMN adenylyltransferase
VRECVAAGDIAGAKRLLGRDFTIRGQVVHGKHLGREIGYPTINLNPETERQLLPADGVYSGYAKVGLSGSPVRSAISVGTNPTTDGDSIRKVEAYLLDGFDQDVYDAQIDLSFIERLREQRHFSSIEPLIEQIATDVEMVRKTLPRSV